jgi:hypothetical protein
MPVSAEGIFAHWQPIYSEHGIATFPVRLGEVKKPAVKNYLKIGKAASAAFAERFGEASAFGFACERSKIAVLDVDTDDERVLADALDRHGRGGDGDDFVHVRDLAESGVRPEMLKEGQTRLSYRMAQDERNQKFKAVDIRIED